jgi:hypothetical protein
MSNITLGGNPAGTATFIVQTPATNTNRTLTLPDQTATLATSADVAAVEGMVGLGTMNAGNSYTLTGLNLTDYKQLLIDMNGVSHNSGSAQSLSLGAGVIQTNLTASDASYGQVWVSIQTGVATSLLSRAALPAGFSNNQNAQTGYSNATVSVGLSISGGAFDNGNARLYGVK